MRLLKFLQGLVLPLSLLAVLPSRAEEARPEPPAKPVATAPAFELPADSTTEHAIQLNGKAFAYKATAGTLPLLGGKGEVAAKIFYVAYTSEAAAPRPVTFAFNGGPGAASAFLQLGAIGPRIVPFEDNGAAARRPIGIADNPNSWLAFTDLVFLDPVGTGYSRANGGGDAEKAYWSVDKDVDSIADAIRLYLSRNGRNLSPIYLAGESYGGFRAAELSDKLLSMGLQAEGVVMISPALEFSVLHGDDYSVLPLTFALPSLAAAHREMKEGEKSSLDSVREAEDYAKSAYLLHLANGMRRDDAVNAALSKFTGLDQILIAKHNGRVSTRLFLREYLLDNGRALSAYDATVSVPVPQPTDNPHYDPILDGAVAVLSPAAVSYFGGELGYKTGLDYRLLNREVSGHWDYGIKHQGYAGSLDSLEQARVRNPALKILIAHGYTDLVTPYAMSRYLLSQLRPLESAAVPTLKIYRGGHMMYLRPASRASLSSDVREFYTGIGEH